jgi:hypothetical protein
MPNNPAIAKGEARISINDPETEAKLVFEPGPSGQDWNITALRKLITDVGIISPTSLELDRFLRKAADSYQPLEILIAEGDPVVEITPETVTWDYEGIPQDMKTVVKEVLDKAGKPELFRIKTERVKTETKVIKRRKLPFMSPKEETVVSWDKRGVSHPVEVDPAIQKTGFVEKGLRAGIVNPPKPGRPGKSIFGRTIQPQTLENRDFFFGYGLFREESEIRVMASGILRIGANWADVVPLAKSTWEIGIANDGLTLYMRFSPGDPRFPPPPVKDILEAVSPDPIEGISTDILIDGEELKQAMERSIETQKPIPVLPLYKSRHGGARVESSLGNTKVLRAWKALAGGQPLVSRMISQVLQDSQVQGYNIEDLRARIQNFLAGTDLEMIYPLSRTGH